MKSIASARYWYVKDHDQGQDQGAASTRVQRHFLTCSFALRGCRLMRRNHGYVSSITSMEHHCTPRVLLDSTANTHVIALAHEHSATISCSDRPTDQPTGLTFSSSPWMNFTDEATPRWSTEDHSVAQCSVRAFTLVPQRSRTDRPAASQSLWWRRKFFFHCRAATIATTGLIQYARLETWWILSIWNQSNGRASSSPHKNSLHVRSLRVLSPYATLGFSTVI